MGRAAPHPRIALIVEDEDEVRDLAAALLEETDLDVVETETAQDAMDYLDRNARDVAFLFADVRTSSRLDGVGLARVAREKWPWVRVVLTSGSPLDEGRDSGCDFTEQFRLKFTLRTTGQIENDRDGIATPASATLELPKRAT